MLLRASAHLALGLTTVLVLACASRPTPSNEPPSKSSESANESANVEAKIDASSSSDDQLKAAARDAYLVGNWRDCAQRWSQLENRVALSLDQHYEAACCFSLLGNSDSAFVSLSKSADLGFRDHQYMLVDEDLKVLHHESRWADITSAVAANALEYRASVNGELFDMFNEDLADRMTEAVDWDQVRQRDENHRERARVIVDSGEAKVADDWFHAAMIMQHGSKLEHYELAHRWALRAVDLDNGHSMARQLAATAMDRSLWSQGKPQLYGTQFVPHDGQWVVYEVDPSITDEERARWGVRPLAEAQRRALLMNAKEE